MAAKPDKISEQLQALRKLVETQHPDLRIRIIDSIMAEPYLMVSRNMLTGLILRVNDQNVLLRPVMPSPMLSLLPGLNLLGGNARKQFVVEMRQWLDSQGYVVQEHTRQSG